MRAINARNTSTCVEKTVTVCDTVAVLEKHLHVRGENNPAHKKWIESAETPPRAWRKLLQRRSTSAAVRNTSTCVEKTGYCIHIRYVYRKHLHVRGENGHFAACYWVKIETPPRAWRKLSQNSQTPSFLRNTSTCVEKTSKLWASIIGVSKHLHVRGENPHVASLLALFQETPPRAWRKLNMLMKKVYTTRNTSTCVEKTQTYHLGIHFAQKHLHVRGENWYAP